MQCSKHRRICVILALVAGWAQVACHPLASSPDRGLLAALERGVNLGDWWTDSAASKVLRPAHHPTAADLEQIRAAGFGHVRVPVAGHRLWRGDSGRFGATEMAPLLDDVDAILDAGLAIILALQLDDESKLTLATDRSAQQRAAANWAALAGAMADRPADRLAFELLNEPVTEDAPRWMQVQKTLARAVRKAAPRHTLVLAGAHYSDIDDLERLEPLDDDNVVYAFHFYTPHNFTHQGADWGWPMWELLSGLPYPADPDAVADIAREAPPPARPHVQQYGREGWAAAGLAAEIARARRWADRHKVHVHCTEFGVIAGAPAASRLRWLEDVRTAFEANNIGWTVWDYAGRFALVEPREPDAGETRTIPPGMRRALGLPG